MSDMSAVIVPKSDQINADDLIGGDLTIRITGVSVSPGQDQPVSMKFEGSTKVFRPCKSMARVMVAAWGPDSSTYVGRSLQLYRDPSVKWGGMDVGGIRIRAMSNMPNDRPMTMALTEKKGSRKPYTVNPLAGGPKRADPPRKPVDGVADDPNVAAAKAAAAKGSDYFRTWYNTDEGKDCRASGAITEAVLADCRTIASGADNMRPKLEADEVGKALADADPMDTGTLPAPTDEEIQREIAESHAREMARLEGGE